MSLKDNWNNPARQARLEMETAERQAKRSYTEEKKLEDGNKAVQTPRRYRLYDKINVSMRTMDIIIYSIVALIVICLIIGVATGQ